MQTQNQANKNSMYEEILLYADIIQILLFTSWSNFICYFGA